MLFTSPSRRRLFAPRRCSRAEQGLPGQPVLRWEHSQSLLPGRWQAGEGGKHLSCLPACLRVLYRKASPPPLPQKTARCPALFGAARAAGSILALIRTRREMGKVQAGVKKAQGGSSRISLTSQRVQPRRSVAAGTLQYAPWCRGSGHHHQTRPAVTFNGPFLLPDTGCADPPAGGLWGSPRCAQLPREK